MRKIVNVVVCDYCAVYVNIFQDDTSGDYRKILLTLTGSQQFIK